MPNDPRIPTKEFLESIGLQHKERYLPTTMDESHTILEKLNRMGYDVNQNTVVTKEVITKWNEFSGWLNSEFPNDVNKQITDQVSKELSNEKIVNLTKPTINTLVDGKLTEVNKNLTNVTAQLAEKADKSSLTQKRDKSTLITMNDISQDIKTAMTGGSVAVVGKDSVSIDTMTLEVANQLFSKSEINKFNKKSFKKGYSMNSMGVVAASPSGLGYSDPMEVVGGGAYFFYTGDTPIAQAVRYLTQFDVNMNPLGTSATEHEYAQNIRTKTNAKYIVVTVSEAQAETLQIISGNTPPTKYNPYYVNTKPLSTIQKEVEILSNQSGNHLKNKKMLTYGTSQTGQNKWQPFVVEATGIIHTNFGHGGYPIAQVSDSNVGYALSSDYMLSQLSTKLNESNADILILEGGTNDFTYDGSKTDFNTITMGDITHPYNVKTFKGALCKIVDHVSTNFPNVRIILLGVIGGLTKQAGVNLNQPLKNLLGYTIGDYAKATEEVAHYFGVRYTDVYGKSGISHRNSSTYLDDGIHLRTETGGKRVAKVVISELKEIEPIA